ncbi:MAG TPA: serine/threonine-protein kinase [Gemmatimonadaceae bacterium]|nr:serine/threonine-protein kinase [Gemmatimonadaceae bacterium]
MNSAKICTHCGAEFDPEQRFCPNDGTPLRPRGSHDPLIGQVIADRYQVLQLLGEGGMGRVYLAEHVRMGRKSAVKVMSPNLALSAEAISRFNREASNASRINHPNVAQIYDFGETSDGMLYLAMEFVEGETLRQLIERDGPMPAPRAADITMQVAGALAAAHHLGIVHRDLKPDNVMIARHHDGTDWVKVVDFGIAKTVQGSGESGAGSQTVTTAGVSLGTPEYMSPEQLAGERLDSRTDLYSLALVLFNMLTGDLPYPRVTSKDTLVRRLTSRPRQLADVAPDGNWPTRLQAALDRALAQEPAERYSTVVDFGRDVVAASAELRDTDRTVRIASVRPMRLSEPTQRVVPPTPASIRKLQPRAKPNRAALAAAGVLLVALAAAGGAYVATRSRSGTEAGTTRSNSGVDTATTVAKHVDSIRSDSAKPNPAPSVSAKPDSVKLAANLPAASPSKSAPPPAPVVPQAEPLDTTKPQPTATPPITPHLPRRGEAPGAHSWLRANGDSGAPAALPPNPTDAQRIKLVTDEIAGHMVRAGQYLSQADVPHLRGELRNVQSEVAVIHQLYPEAVDSINLDWRVRQAAMRLLSACPLVVADTSKHFPPNFKCDQLLGGFGRGRQGQGGMGRRPPLRH